MVKASTKTQTEAERSRALATTDNVGFLLAKASARWNELLMTEFVERGFAEVRPAYGSILLPLYERDGLRMGDLSRRARLSKQTMTTLIGQMERDGLVRRELDPADGRARRVLLTERASQFRPIAEEVLSNLEARVAEHLSQRTTAVMKRGLKGITDL